MSENNGSNKSECNDRPSERAGKSAKKISTTKADKMATATSTDETEIEKPLQKLLLTESEQISSQNERKRHIQGSAGKATRRLSQDAVLPERLLVVSKTVSGGHCVRVCMCKMGYVEYAD